MHFSGNGAANMDFKAFWKEKWNIVLFFVFAGVVAVAVLYVSISGRDERVLFSTGNTVDISEDWKYEYSDGVSGTTALPGALPWNKSRIMTLSKTLPDVADNMYLIFRARHTFVRISIDGKVVIDRLSQAEEKNDWYTLEGLYYIEVPMSHEYSGKEIRIDSYSSEPKYLSRPGAIYLGERGTFVIDHIDTKMSALICYIILLLTSIIIFSLWLVAEFLMKTNLKEMLCLAFFTLAVALWIFTETEFMQILGYGTRSSVLLAHEVLILMPVPIALYFYYASERKSGKLASRIASTVPICWFVLANLLHLFRLVSITNTLFVTQFLLICELIVVGTIQIKEINYMHHSEKFGNKMSKIPLLGILIIIPLGLMEIGRYLFTPGGYSGDGRLITVGVVVYIFSLALDSVVRTTYKQAQLENASSMKTQFLANMSHEIRTPLNAILGFNEAIIREPANEEQVKGYAGNIREAGENLKDIINSILDISKIEMGQLQIESREYSSLELLDNLSSMFELLAQKKALTFKTDIDPDIPSVLIGDEAHLRQILTNILSNAVKYTDQGSVTLKVEVLEKQHDTPMCKLRFTVKDTGRGIKEEDRKKLFEKFSRLDTEHFKHVEGTGLGMSIVQLTLSAMGSEIQMDSVFGEGTTFWFDIDQVAIDKNGIGDFNERRQESSLKENQSIRFRAPNAEVLIVDDVQMNIDAAKALLSFTHMKMDAALSGTQAIEMVQKKRYDIIFMDHMMPGMDGIEATEKIRNLSVEYNDAYYAMVPVIALTANAIVGVKTLYQQAGMQDFVSKPMQVTSIISALKRWLPKELIEEVSEDLPEDGEAFGGDNEEDWTLGIDGIDVQEARKYNINADGLKANLHSYSDAFENNSGEIEDYYTDGALDDYIIKVHGLKSTSKMIGAVQVYNLAKAIETKGNEEHTADDKEFKHLMTLYKGVVDNIRHYFADNGVEMVSLSEGEYQALLERILKAGEAFDTMEFMTMDEEMNAMEVPAEHEEEFEKLKLCVSLLQYTEAANIISQKNNN